MPQTLGSSMNRLIIPRSHYDDFMSHVGWWAVMEKPAQLTVNQSFEIEIGDFFHHLEVSLLIGKD